MFLLLYTAFWSIFNNFSYIHQPKTEHGLTNSIYKVYQESDANFNKICSQPCRRVCTPCSTSLRAFSALFVKIFYLCLCQNEETDLNLPAAYFYIYVLVKQHLTRICTNVVNKCNFSSNFLHCYSQKFYTPNQEEILAMPLSCTI